MGRRSGAGETPVQARPTNVVRLESGPMEYRLERRARDAVVVFHGGHMHAGLALGEDVFADHGYTVLVPSRPGYGRTPLGTGTSPGGFADATRQLCQHLGLDQVAAVLGISAGGRTAVTMAARHPDLVQRVILNSALSSLPWPDHRTRLAANLVFRPPVEKLTWRVVRALLRLAPRQGLRILLGAMSTEPGRDVVAGLSDAGRNELIDQFSLMRSGKGFLNDMNSTPDVTGHITQPTLVIASRWDGQVRFAHADTLAAKIDRAELVDSGAASHLFWVDPGYGAVTERMSSFLRRE